MLKDSSYAFAEVGFRTKLYLLDKARRKGVLMDDGEEDEEELDHADIIAQYSAFGDDILGEMMKRMRQRQKMWQLMMMLLVMSLAMHKVIVKVTRRRPSSSAC